ncbi:anti-sigma factor family protein [Undibacterium sp. TJN25]|uniref:anti-sigma factor family protein n=1 Tax=Undibacterium sp. TJN25 TaxID=3413056 RepID=UPI003BEF5470
MNCQESRRLLQAYADQQLAPQDMQMVDEHLIGCAACSAELKQLQSLRRAVRTQAEQHVAPEYLRRRIQLAVRGAAGEVAQAAAQTAAQAAASPPRRARPQPRGGWPWAWINFGLATACAAALALVLVLPPSVGLGDDRLAQEITDSHFRSLLADHLADVASSDQHTVKPWFTGKLDFAPPVFDFAQQEYPLTGGRLDYVAQRTVAALIYRHKRHVLNLYIWPSVAQAAAPKHLARQGYQLLHWTQAGMQYWLVSDMAAADLDRFQTLLASQLQKDGKDGGEQR